MYDFCMHFNNHQETADSGEFSCALLPCSNIQFENVSLYFFHNLVHHCSGIPEIKSLIINTLVIDNNHISKDMVSTKAQIKTKSALPLVIRTENKDIDNWMENYEDDDYFEEKDFQDCKTILFLSGKLGKIAEGFEKQ